MAPVSRRSVLSVTGAGLLTAAVGAPRARAADPSRRIAIIGSGYGGAVAARALTQAGFSVDLIEMGLDWRTMPADPSTGRVFDSMTSPTWRSTWKANWTDMPFANFLGLPVVNRLIGKGPGVLDTVKFPGMKVYRGVGVGGGSLVNAGMTVTPRQSFFKAVLPQLDDAEMYSTYYPRAHALLRSSAPEPDLLGSKYYQFSTVGEAQAVKAGYDVSLVPTTYDKDYMRREVAGTATASSIGQEVIFGNNHGKIDITKTLLQDAFATGRVTLRAQTEVQDISRLADGTFRLDFTTIDRSGADVGAWSAVYDRVVMAAGSVGTSQLLVKARAKGTIAGLPDQTGRSWGPNGNVMVSRLHNQAVGGQASTIPAQGINAWDDSTASVFAEIAPLPIGLETFSSLYLALTNNPNLGSFFWDGKAVSLNWSSAMAAPSVAAARTVMDKLNRVNGGVYRHDLFERAQAFADYFCYHPLGGMVIGEATDLQGEVRGVPGLFVMDGALIPGRLGVNPFATITALALRNMDKLLATGRF